MNKAAEQEIPELNAVHENKVTPQGSLSNAYPDNLTSNENDFPEDTTDRGSGQAERNVITRVNTPSTVITQLRQEDIPGVVEAPKNVDDPSLKDNIYEIIAYGTVEERDNDNNLVLVPYVEVEIHPGLDANNRPRKRYKGKFIPTKLIGAVQKLIEDNNSKPLATETVQSERDVNLKEVKDADTLPKHNIQPGVVNKTPDTDLLMDEGFVKLGE